MHPKTNFGFARYRMAPGFAQILILIGILVVAIAAGAYYFGNLKSKPAPSPTSTPPIEGKTCGGIAGNLPDASGKCVKDETFCKIDSDCGVELCGCKAKNKEFIDKSKFICAVVCGSAKCVNNKCELQPYKAS